MARRAVKTIDHALDLGPVLKEPDELPRPFQTELLFGRTAPLELEIGSGKGLFIRNASDFMPDHDFLGIEIGQKYARFCAAKLAHRPQRNAVMVCGDAFAVLKDILHENLLHAVHVYFPDPWWKRAHRKRRILRTEVLKLIESRLKPAGTLHFWTDVQEYYLSTLKLIAAETTLIGPLAVDEKEATHEFDYRTHYERRTRLNGAPVYRAEFRKPNEKVQ